MSLDGTILASPFIPPSPLLLFQILPGPFTLTRNSYLNRDRSDPSPVASLLVDIFHLLASSPETARSGPTSSDASAIADRGNLRTAFPGPTDSQLLQVDQAKAPCMVQQGTDFKLFDRTSRLTTYVD